MTYPWERGHKRRLLNPTLYDLPQILADRAQIEDEPATATELIERSLVPRELWMKEQRVAVINPAKYEDAADILSELVGA